MLAMHGPSPIIPWTGGKHRLANHPLPYFPMHECYVEVSASGAALLFLRDEPTKVEVLNDVNGELVNLYRVVQRHRRVFGGLFMRELTIRYSVTSRH